MDTYDIERIEGRTIEELAHLNAELLAALKVAAIELNDSYFEGNAGIEDGIDRILEGIESAIAKGESQ